MLDQPIADSIGDSIGDSTSSKREWGEGVGHVTRGTTAVVTQIFLLDDLMAQTLKLAMD